MLAGADGISYDWQWYRVWRYLGRWTDGHFIPGPLLDGLGMTVRIALFGLALAVAAGLGAALLRLSPWPVARGMAHVYVGCLRNTPLLLQLFFVYFLFAPAIGVGPFGAAVLALGLFEGAYMAELFRAGLQSVPRAQWEAGSAPDVAAADQPACFAHQGHLARQRHRRGGSHHAGAGVDRGYVPCV